MSAGITALTASVAVRSGIDPALRVGLPRRPRFVREHMVLAVGEKMVVDGAEQLHVFEGRAAQGVLATLISLMDGSRTIEDLQHALPEVPQEEIAEAISTLFRCYLIEDEADAVDPFMSINLETLAFCRRYAGATAVNRSGLEAWQKLQNSEVVILDSGSAAPQVESLGSLLQAIGIGRVVALPTESLPLRRPDANRHSLIVSLCLGAEDLQRQQELDEWCFERKLSWLRASMNVKAGWADIGPLFNPLVNSCYRCFRAMHRQSDDRPLAGTLVTSTQAQSFVSLLAIEIVYALNQIGVPLAGNRFQRYMLPEWRDQSLHWVRVPGCSRCSPATNHTGNIVSDRHLVDFINSSYVFESYLAHESKPISYVKEQEAASRLGKELNRQSARFWNCRQYILSNGVPKLECETLAILAQTRPALGKTPGIHELAALLLMTAGIRGTGGGDKTQRWAATGGNLGSVQLFVAVRCIAGLKPGLYCYQPREHSLALFERRSGALPIEQFMRRIVFGADELPEVMVLFVGAFGRISRKYNAFGYRLINFDAGAALSQLKLLAGSLDINCQIHPRWADDLIADQLNLDGIREQVTAVVSLWAKTPPPMNAPGFNASATSRPVSAKTPEAFTGISLDALLEMVHRESRLRERDLGQPVFAVPPELVNLSGGKGDTMLLPPPRSGGELVGSMLAQRTSIRHYMPDPVSMDQLSTMLYSAQFGDQRDWPQEHVAGHSLRLLAVAQKVEALHPGVYEYDAEGHSLILSAGPLIIQDTAELFLQSEFAAAPLILWIAGNLAAACAAQGAFGHRQLLLRAGAAAHRLWMAAMAMGLGGSIVAGVVSGAARRLLGLDGFQKTSLLAFAAGYPLKSPGLRPGRRPGGMQDTHKILV